MKKVYRQEGPIGFYRGFWATLFGSAAYLTSQLTILELFYSKFNNNPKMTTQIPYTGGLEVRIIGAALTASVVRTLVECPFEYAKVRRQTN